MSAGTNVSGDAWISPELQKLCDHGTDVASWIPELAEDNASPRMQQIFTDIRQCLRVPITNYLFRTLANFPDFLEAAWTCVRAHVSTSAFEAEADFLRAGALIEPVPSVRGLAPAARDQLQRLRDVTNTAHYVLPKLQLIATAFDALARDPRRHKGGPQPQIEAGAALPTGAPERAASFPKGALRIEPDELVQMVFEDIKQVHRHPQVAAFYRTLAVTPGFLVAAWNRLRPTIASKRFEIQRRLVIRTAEAMVRDWRMPPFNPTLAMWEVRGLVAFNRLRMTPDVMLDVCLIKALLDGPDQARASPFSALATPKEP